MLLSVRSSERSRVEPISTLAVGLPATVVRSEIIFPDIATSVLTSPLDDVQELKKQYSNLIIQIDRIRPALTRIPRDARVADVHWTVTEVFGHLIDADRDIWWPRIDQLLVEERPFFSNVDPEALVGTHNWESIPLDDVLSQLMRIRWNNSMRLNTLPRAAFDRTGIHTEHGEMSLSQILAVIVAHDSHYLSLVRSLLEHESQDSH
jgi:hypothetical protein